MKKIITTIILGLAFFITYGQVDTTYHLDISQNVSRAELNREKTFGEYVTEYNEYFSLTQIASIFSEASTFIYGYEITVSIEQIEKMKRDELVPLPQAYRFLVEKMKSELDILNRQDRTK